MASPDDAPRRSPLADRPTADPGQAPDLSLDLSLGIRPSPVAGLNVLVVGINYAPEPTGIAPYTTGVAEHLAASAARVDVLTGVPHYPSWEVPEGFGSLRSVQATAPDGAPHVHRLRHYVPGRQTAARRAAYDATFLAQAATVRPRVRPDLVVAATPSLGGAVAAARIARRCGAPLVTVVQDLVAAATAQSGIPGGGAVSGLAGRMEGYALRGADRVAIVSETFRPAVEAYGVRPERVVLLPNWTHISAVPVSREQARARLGWRVGGFSVVHTGNMGLKQDLGNVIEAARLLAARDDVTFYLVGHGSQRGPLRRQATGLPNVRFVDPLDADTYPLALAAADVLLVNERPTVGEMSLPSKLTSYLSAGRPVLAAVWPGGATGRELDRTRGAALRVDPGSPVRLAGAVEALDADPAGRVRMGEAARSYADARLGRERAMARLDQMLSDLLSPSADHPLTRGTR